MFFISFIFSPANISSSSINTFGFLFFLTIHDSSLDYFSLIRFFVNAEALKLTANIL